MGGYSGVGAVPTQLEFRPGRLNTALLAPVHEYTSTGASSFAQLVFFR